jgi:hypothetical protein
MMRRLRVIGLALYVTVMTVVFHVLFRLCTLIFG